MISLPAALVVGATSRNCGKTSFICQIIDQVREYQPVAIKIKTVYPNDSAWHGKGSTLNTPFVIREETADSGMDDSKRFLKAGAQKVFYVKSFIDNLELAMESLLELIPDNCPLIFESNSILDVLNPAAFIMIRQSDTKSFKPSAIRLIHKANLLIETDGEKHSPPPSALAISWNGNKWNLD